MLLIACTEAITVCFACMHVCVCMYIYIFTYMRICMHKYYCILFHKISMVKIYDVRMIGELVVCQREAI